MVNKFIISCTGILLSMVLVLIIPPTMAAIPPETMCSDLEDITLDYTISTGKVLEVCVDDSLPTVFMNIESDVEGQLTVEIPRSVVYSINQECDSFDLFILVNDDDETFTTQNTILSRIITLNFPAGNSSIEFIGTYTLGLPVQAYCGVIYGHDSVFMSPKFQVDNGFRGDVLCNYGLEVVRKISDNTQACVTPETTQKLMERGWMPGGCNSIHAAPNVDFSYCSFIGADFSGKDLQGANLYNTRFEGANLSGVNFQDADISRTYFVDANLRGADLRGLDFTISIFKNTDITEALVTLEDWGVVNLDKLIGWDDVIDPKYDHTITIQK